jgi:hypothetical protein
MFPTDSEFILLYFSYLGVFLYFLLGSFLSDIKKIKINLTLFLIYTAFMIFIFSDKENFVGGGSLVVLFYGGIFLFIHLLIYVAIEFIFLLRKKLKINSNK